MQGGSLLGVVVQVEIKLMEHIARLLRSVSPCFRNVNLNVAVVLSLLLTWSPDHLFQQRHSGMPIDFRRESYHVLSSLWDFMSFVVVCLLDCFMQFLQQIIVDVLLNFFRPNLFAPSCEGYWASSFSSEL